MLSGYKNWLLTHLTVDTDLVKAGLIANYCFYSVLLGAIYALFYLFIGFYEGLIIISIAILFIAFVPFMFLKTSNHTIVSNLFLIISWAVIFSVAILSGKIFSNIVPWLAFIIITAVLLTNSKNALIWLLISISTIVFLYVQQQEILSIGLHYKSEYSSLYFCIGYTGLCVLVYITSYLFQEERMKHIIEIELKSLKLRRKNEELEKVKHDLVERNNEIQEANKSISEQAKEILKINKHLEAMVQTSTAELEVRNQQLEEYTHMNSHQLRSPICTILGLYNLMNHVESEEDIPELLDKLKVTITELDSITKKVSKEVNKLH